MKRDMELVRSILLEIEKNEQPRMSASAIIKALEAEKDEVDYLLTILEDGGFLDHLVSKPVPNGAGWDYGWRLTWTGHEFLESVRDPEVWRKTKEAANQVGGWSVSILARIATGYIQTTAQQLGIPIS